MITTRSIRLLMLMRWMWFHMAWLLLASAIISHAYRFGHIEFSLPWLPISVIGTAVAFYVGFKNNSAYDRLWEARKIWGAIVNTSRTWGLFVDTMITNHFTSEPIGDDELKTIKQRLIYRHIAWLYTLRQQLTAEQPWEHASDKGPIGMTARYFARRFGIGQFSQEVEAIDVSALISRKDLDAASQTPNAATALIHQQGKELETLRERDLIDDFRHMRMAGALEHLYDHQGKCERIKKYPLPRQYASMSRYFVAIFIFLMPFGMVPQMLALGEWGFWLSIPITALIGWVYVAMEMVGDYSEHPFNSMANGMPMLSLCRTIENDLRTMLGEKDLPPAIPIKNDVLM